MGLSLKYILLKEHTRLKEMRMNFRVDMTGFLSIPFSLFFWHEPKKNSWRW